MQCLGIQLLKAFSKFLVVGYHSASVFGGCLNFLKQLDISQTDKVYIIQHPIKATLEILQMMYPICIYWISQPIF